MFKKLFKLFKKAKEFELCDTCNEILLKENMSPVATTQVTKYICKNCELTKPDKHEEYIRPFAETVKKMEGLPSLKYKNKYTQEEVELISKLYLNGLSFEQIAERVGRTPCAIASKIKRIKSVCGTPETKSTGEIKKVRVWTTKEVLILKSMCFSGKSLDEIAVSLGRSKSSVRNKAGRVGIYECKSNHKNT